MGVRWQVDTQMTQQLSCPSAAHLAPLLRDQVPEAVTILGDMAELADACGAPSLDIILDVQTHAQQSLLHAGLARTQGPALCFSLPGEHAGAPLLVPASAHLQRGGMCRSSLWAGQSGVPCELVKMFLLHSACSNIC